MLPVLRPSLIPVSLYLPLHPCPLWPLLTAAAGWGLETGPPSSSFPFPCLFWLALAEAMPRSSCDALSLALWCVLNRCVLNMTSSPSWSASHISLCVATEAPPQLPVVLGVAGRRRPRVPRSALAPLWRAHSLLHALCQPQLQPCGPALRASAALLALLGPSGCCSGWAPGYHRGYRSPSPGRWQADFSWVHCRGPTLELYRSVWYKRGWGA